MVTYTIATSGSFGEELHAYTSLLMRIFKSIIRKQIQLGLTKCSVWIEANSLLDFLVGCALRYCQYARFITFKRGRETMILRFPSCATHTGSIRFKWLRHICGHRCGRPIHHCPPLTSQGHFLTPHMQHNYQCQKGGAEKSCLYNEARPSIYFLDAYSSLSVKKKKCHDSLPPETCISVFYRTENRNTNWVTLKYLSNWNSFLPLKK